MNQPSSGFFTAGGKPVYLVLPVLFLSICTAILPSCRQPSARQTGAAYTGKDLFPDKVEIRYAKGFTVDYHANYKVVQVFNGIEGHMDTLQYVLVQRGTPTPGNYPKARQISIPLSSMIGTSSMHVALADFAASTGILTGLENLRYVSTQAVRENIVKGRVKEVGVEGNLNNELIVTMHPDMVMITENPETKFSKYQSLTEAGIPVLQNAEWMETTPLGQAEWVKLMAVLVNKEELVNKKFALVEEEYNRLAALGRKASGKPCVITGLPYKGTWFVPRGGSFFARLLHDAGTRYKWSSQEGTGNLALSFESVAPEALVADFWVNTSDALSRKDIAGRDNRYADFRPFKTRHIYNNNNRITDLGSNDYWESGGVHPELVLADLLSIFHPELLPGHQLFYYKQLQ